MWTSLIATYFVEERNIFNHCFSHIVNQDHTFSCRSRHLIKLENISADRIMSNSFNWTSDVIRHIIVIRYMWSNTIFVNSETSRRIQSLRRMFFKHSINSRKENDDTSRDIVRFFLLDQAIEKKWDETKLELCKLSNLDVLEARIVSARYSYLRSHLMSSQKMINYWFNKAQLLRHLFFALAYDLWNNVWRTWDSTSSLITLCRSFTFAFLITFWSEIDNREAACLWNRIESESRSSRFSTRMKR